LSYTHVGRGQLPIPAKKEKNRKPDTLAASEPGGYGRIRQREKTKPLRKYILLLTQRFPVPLGTTFTNFILFPKDNPS